MSVQRSGESSLSEREKAARWAMSIADTEMRAPIGFEFPSFKRGDWQSRRAATAALVCQWARQGLEALVRKGALSLAPRPVFDPDCRSTGIKDVEEALQSFGHLKLGGVQVAFWPTIRRVGHWDGEEAMAPKMGSKSFVPHWRLRSSTALFGSVAMSMRAKKEARELVGAWLDQELSLESMMMNKGQGALLWAVYERECLGSAGALAPSKPAARL